METGKRPKNPLHKRVWRDLIRDWKRYLMIFLMLVVTIGFVSGMFVANHSMMSSLNGNAAKFHREDGHFELSRIPAPEIISAIESGEKADMVSFFRSRTALPAVWIMPSETTMIILIFVPPTVCSAGNGNCCTGAFWRALKAA